MARLEELQELLFLSSLLTYTVYAQGGGAQAAIVDFVADITALYPQVTGVLVRTGKRTAPVYIPLASLEIQEKFFVLAEGFDRYTEPYRRKQTDILLREAFLDRQIVDTNGAKIRRVNDLQLLHAKGSLYLVHVDVGFRGLMRRVGLLRLTDSLLNALFDYELSDHFISWRFVQPLASPDLIRLTLSTEKLARMHPADLADIIEDLDIHQRNAVFQSLDVETAADALEETDSKIQISLIEDLETAAASDILEEMSQSEAADLLGDLPEETAEEILREMEQDVAEDMKELLAHVEDVSGGMMTTSVLSFSPSTTVQEVFAALRESAENTDFIYYLYVVNENNHLAGVVSLRELFAAPSESRLIEIMHERVVTVHIDDTKENIADIFSKYGVIALPVVDDDMEMRGAIIFKNLLEAVAPHLG